MEKEDELSLIDGGYGQEIENQVEVDQDSDSDSDSEDEHINNDEGQINNLEEQINNEEGQINNDDEGTESDFGHSIDSEGETEHVINIADVDGQVVANIKTVKGGD